MKAKTGGDIMNVWTWDGIYFGYIDGNNLWTHNGKHVGRLHNEKIFGPDGRYLGEIRNGNRLITRNGNNHLRAASFSPNMSRIGRVKCVDYVGNVMIAGYHDFPSPEEFE